jgi:YHS domain-containing protein
LAAVGQPHYNAGGSRTAPTGRRGGNRDRTTNPVVRTIPMMIAFRKTCWAALALAALAGGCSSEEPAAPAGPPPGPGPATVTPPEAKGGMPAMKGESSLPPAAEPTKAEPPKVEPPATEPGKTETPKAAAVILKDDEIAAIKKLPAGEQVLALKQAVCPVSGDHLGSMDVPFKVSAEGKTFFLCCDGCEKEVKADPKAVVAKLPK